MDQSVDPDRQAGMRKGLLHRLLTLGSGGRARRAERRRRKERPSPEQPAADRAPPPKRLPRALFIAPLAVVGALVAWGAWTHWSAGQRAAQAQQEQSSRVPTLRVAVAKREDGPVTLTLPAMTAPFDMARLFARATGFVAERRVDIGSRVKQGDLLLRIGAPDLVAQLVQASAQLGQTRASLVQAKANVRSAQSNVDLARVTNFRTSTLASQGWETRQNADNTSANVQAGSAAVDAANAAVVVAEANVAAQLATVQRLQALVGYLQVTAPFDGVVTMRSVDTGDLVSADASGGTALFALQRDDVLRVQVAVPQSGALSLRDGLTAKVQVPELPGHPFTGTVSRNAVALDPNSRSVQVEVDLPNAEHELRPGLYATVSFDIPRDQPGVVVPDEAVLFNGSGLRVAVIGPDDTVSLRDVSIARDFGTTVELRAGLRGGERVALSPPVDLADGSKVKVQAPAPDGSPKP